MEGLSAMWSESPSRSRRPSSAWPAIRAQALERDGAQCTILTDAGRCPNQAHEVDHVRPRSQGGPDTLDNAASICAEHHKAKTAAEAAAVRWAPNRRITRPTERHPGLL